MNHFSLSHLADHVLGRELTLVVSREREATASVLAHLAEFDARRLYAPAGYPSMYEYCVRELRYSENSAVRRIRGARLAREYPAVLAAIADGRLHLSGLCLLAPRLAPGNADELLEAAAHLSRADIELLLARRFPQPDMPTVVQPIPRNSQQFPPSPVTVETSGPAGALALAPPAVHELSCGGAVATIAQPEPATRTTPLAPERFALQVTIGKATHEKLRYAQALLSHVLPPGDLAGVLDRALDALVQRLEKRKFGAASRTPRTAQAAGANARTIPAAVRREVCERDGGRCTFVSDAGVRCESREQLEFDHVIPVALGGTTTAPNLRLRCRTHNLLAADRALGAGFMDRKRRRSAERVAREAAAARAREAERVRRETRARELDADEQARARALEVVPWLRALGVRTGDARRAAKLCETIPEASLEDRVKHALRSLAPPSARKVLPVASAG